MFASAKLRAPFVTWAKVEAARRGQPLYEIVEDLTAEGLGGRPWLRTEFQRGARPRALPRKHRRHRY